MRSIISVAKVVWPYLLSAVYGVLDRIFGDRVFAWIKPLIPQELSPENLRLLATYVPPLLFIALGLYLNFGRKKSIAEAAARNSSVGGDFSDQILRMANNSWSINQTANNNIINKEEPARLIIVSESGPYPRDSWHLYVYRVKLTKTASRISVKAQGENVLALDISRPIVGLRSSTSKSEVFRSPIAGGLGLEEQFSNASGEYEIIIVCKTADPPSLAYDLTP